MEGLSPAKKHKKTISRIPYGLAKQNNKIKIKRKGSDI